MRGEEAVSGRSINLALSVRGIHALKMAGLMDEVEALLIPMRGRRLHFINGQQELMPYGQRPEEVIHSVSRRDLNSLMMTAAENSESVRIRFNQKLESVDFENCQIDVRDLKTDQRGKHPFELLVGADGAGSRTRRALMPVVKGKSSSEFLRHDYKELEIPAGADGAFRIEREALHVWPRGEFMLIALPNQDGSFTVTLFMPKTGPNSFEQLVDGKAVSGFFRKNFPDALKLIPDLESDFFTHPQGGLGTVRCSPWFYQDSVLLIGDAAHAIVPFHGQGMIAGFEDCSELIRLLEEFDDDWGKVIPEFDRLRRPNTNAIAEMAVENYVTMRASVADPQFQLKKELGFELEKRFPDRFVPRYSMVMFHRIPYAEVYARGQTQQEILDTLLDEQDSLDDVDYSMAESMIVDRLPVVEFC